MKKRPKKFVENLARNFKEAEEFDVKFWRDAGAQARFSAAWTMLSDYYLMKGKSGHLPRLRRTVQNIERL